MARKKEVDVLKNNVFRNMVIFAFLAFLFATITLFAFSEYDSAKRFKAVNDELKDEIFALQINLSEKINTVEALEAALDSYKERSEQLASGLPVIDYSEKDSSVLNYNLDSDNDGLIDEIDANPQKADNILKTYTWQYKGKTHTIRIPLNKDWYDFYVKKKRATTKEKFITPDDPNIIALTNKLQKIFQENNYRSYSEFVLSFVQNLKYLEDDESKGFPYPRYPVETLMDEEGDCEDKTYLAASILKNLKVDIVLLDVPGHIVVGVACINCEGTYWLHNGKKYYYIESTATGYRLGELPEEYKQYENKVILIRDV